MFYEHTIKFVINKLLYQLARPYNRKHLLDNSLEKYKLVHEIVDRCTISYLVE